MEAIQQLDVALFALINGWNSSWMDPVMETLSSRVAWIPAYAFLAWVLYRQGGWQNLLIVGLFLGFAVVVADQIASSLIKPWAERYRPCRPEAGLDFVVHLVDGHCGGKYGFVSSHAANFFAMAVFLSQQFQVWRHRWLFWVLAGLAAYSRVYLGVHYPGDILGGALVGLFVGAGCWWACLGIKKRNNQKMKQDP